MAYATTAQFIQAYGLRETTQLLQDEREPITEALFSFALEVAAGSTDWKNYRLQTPSQPNIPALAVLQAQMNAFAWLVYSGNDSWSSFAIPAGFASLTQTQIEAMQAKADALVLSTIDAGNAAVLRFQSALDLSSSEIDGYLRGITPLPINPADVSTMLLDECCWVLSRCRLADDCDNSSERIEQNCKDKREWLRHVAKGTITLVTPTGQPLATTARFRSGRTRTGYAWDAHRRQSGGLLPEQHSPIMGDQQFYGYVEQLP